MEKFFTYILKNNAEILRIGKGYTYLKNEQGVQQYIYNRRAYREIPADTIEFFWAASESAAYLKESKFIEDYIEQFGQYPPYNSRRGGGGRHIYLKCKSYLRSGLKCPKEAIAGNYGYCGRHRR